MLYLFNFYNNSFIKKKHTTATIEGICAVSSIILWPDKNQNKTSTDDNPDRTTNDTVSLQKSFNTTILLKFFIFLLLF